MTFLLFLPVILSALLLAAHFLRGGHLLPVAACLAVGLLLAARRRWVARLVQAGLLLGALEWVRTLVAIVIARRLAGSPWARLALILGGVALLTAASALVFRSAPMRRRYRLDS